MVELNAKALGEEIRRLRKTNNLSQAQLAEGVCTQATISGIEAGRGYPSVDILYVLSIRLKVTLEYFFKILLNETHGYIQETEQLLEELLKKKNYQEAYEISKSELKQTGRQVGYKFNKLIEWVYIISSYYLKKSFWSQTIIQLNQLLDDDHPLFGQDFIDFKIQNSIAIIYAENGKFAESLEEYKKILSFKDFLNQNHRFQIKIHYNLSKLYFDLLNYKQSLKHVEIGLSLAKKHEDISMSGQLYFQQGECLEALHKDSPSINHSYGTSMMIFQLLDRQEYVEMVKEQKAHFFN